MVKVSSSPMTITVANGPAIRRIRELAGWTQRDLARAAGLSPMALSLVEAGGGMRPRNLNRVAEILQMPVTALTHQVNRPAAVCAALGITREDYDRLTEAGELTAIGGGAISAPALPR